MSRIIYSNSFYNTNATSKVKHAGRNAGLLTAGFLSIFLLAGCGKEEPQYYEVEATQEVPEVEAQAHDHSAHDGHNHAEAAPSANELGFTYELPEGWSPKVASSMVIAAFQTGQPPELIADISVSAFPGDVGGQLANINRWRRQVGLGPLEPAAAEEVIRTFQVSGLDAWQVDFAGPTTRVVVSAIFQNEKTWFFKMTGPDAVIESQLDKYQAFVNSIGF